MNQDLILLTLDSYLKEISLPNRATTFVREFGETEQLPEIKVGLAMIGHSTLSIGSAPPMDKHGRTYSLNAFINKTAELYLKYSEETPDLWKERIILDLGYASIIEEKTASPKYQYSWNSLEQNPNFLSEIPEEERLPLLRKHGLHKLATLVAYGFASQIDEIITLLENPEMQALNTHWGTIVELLRYGVPLDDLAMAVNLPPDLLEGIYGE